MSDNALTPYSQGAMVLGTLAAGLLTVQAFDDNRKRDIIERIRQRRFSGELADLRDDVVQIVQAGAVPRGNATTAGGFLGGLAYSAIRPAQPQPSPVPTLASPGNAARPTFSRDWALTVGAWPGNQPQFNAEGDYIHPAINQGIVDDFTALGLAMGCPEVIEALGGIASVQAPNAAARAAIFDYFRGLVMQAMATPAVSPLTSEQAFKLWQVVAAGAPATGTTEVNLASASPVVIPAGFFASVGDRLSLRATVNLASTSTYTWQEIVRWGTSNGSTALCTGVATDTADSDTAVIEVDITCRQPSSQPLASPVQDGILAYSCAIAPASTVAAARSQGVLTGQTTGGALPIWLGAVASNASATMIASLSSGQMIGYRQR